MISMSMFLSIKALAEEGLAKKAIARRLGLNVRTVRNQLRRIQAGASEPTKAEGPGKLDRFLPAITAKVDQGLSGIQIYQDLCGESGFEASYPTLQRLVRRLRPASQAEVYCRMRFAPGEEAQIDFGEVARITLGGSLRKVHLFVMTLCWSRLAYYELVLDQTVPTFLGAIRRGIEFLGGAPRSLKPDNLKSAVLMDALGQRYYQEDFFRFCRHYGVVPNAARPATPTDKGRCERDIGYAKSSCFRGRAFLTLEESREHLERWRDEIANVRVHGTTRRRPVDLFQEERPHLLPLPLEPFEISSWGTYLVRKDCHVHVEGNYYSVPYPLVGSRVTVRRSEDAITAFAEGKVVATHALARGKGESVTDEAHYPPEKRTATQELHRRRCLAVRSAGPHAAEFLHRLREGRWVFGPQVRHLASLVRQHGADSVDQACRRALFFGAVEGAPVIERILDRDLQTQPLPETSGASLPRSGEAGKDYGRALEEYAALLGAEEVLHE